MQMFGDGENKADSSSLGHVGAPVSLAKVFTLHVYGSNIRPGLTNLHVLLHASHEGLYGIVPSLPYIHV